MHVRLCSLYLFFELAGFFNVPAVLPPHLRATRAVVLEAVLLGEVRVGGA